MTLRFLLAVAGVLLAPGIARSQTNCLPDQAIPVGLSVTRPCPGQPLFLQASACGPCVHLNGFIADPSSGSIVIQAQMDARACELRLACMPESLTVPLGTFAPGHYELWVRVDGPITYPDSTTCYSRSKQIVAFDVPIDCGGPPPPGLPFVQWVQIGPDRAPICPNRPIPFAIGGEFPDGCYSFRELQVLPSPITGPGPQPPIVRVVVEKSCELACPAVIVPWAAPHIALPGLPPGDYAQVVEVAVASACDSAPAPVVIGRGRFPFRVAVDCGPPPPNPLPYVTAIQVGEPPPCPTCPPPPICAGTPFPVVVAGMLTDDCIEFLGLELLPNPIANPMPQPPIVRVLLRRNDCLEVVCHNGLTPWMAKVVLPGLPAASYQLPVEVVQIGYCDTLPHELGRTLVPFAVASNCSLPPPPTPQGCYLADWKHDPSHIGCDTLVSETTPATLLFQILHEPPIAGLQGRISLEPPALQVTSIRPVGEAQGMRLAWQPRPDGASFVMFSDDGRLIPSNLPCESTCREQPVLEVTVAAIPGTPLPQVTFARMNDLLVTDSVGTAIPQCPTFAPMEMVAGICTAGGGCDANGDGHADVRDLVLMVRCLRGASDCSELVRARLDCARDSMFTFDDVMCCARRILHDSLPDSVPPQPIAGLGVEFGTPVATLDGYEQTVRVRGADRLGAVRFELGLPRNVMFNRLDLVGDPSDWMHLEEASEGRSLIGLLSIAPNVTTELTAVLHFTNPDQVPFAGATLVQAEFVATDGRVVTPPDGVLGIPVDGASPVQLSAARPNPFDGATHFELTLGQAADVQLAIYDLSGRLVLSLHRGSLGAGSHAFTWNGTRSDGTRAPDGVYFYRARTGATVTSRRIVSLRGR